jgi:hypothetical protein
MDGTGLQYSGLELTHIKYSVNNVLCGTFKKFLIASYGNLFNKNTLLNLTFF